MGLSVPPIDANLKDWIQAASWIAAVAGGLFGVVKIVLELRHARSQREQDLRWKKAQAAKSLNDEMLSDEKSHAAMTLLDWDGREFEIKKDTNARITTDEMLKSLRSVDTEFSDSETFVRDAFDNFFYYMGIFEHSVSTRLVDFQDLEHPIEYYVAILAKHRPVVENYMVTYGFTRGLSFLERFEAWCQARTAQMGPPNKAVQPTESAGG